MCENEAGRSYMEADIRTAGPLRLVVLVCDIGIDHLRRAAGNTAVADRDEFVAHTGKAREALMELMEALAPEKCPAVAGNLLALYGYFFRRITEARVDLDAEPLKEVMKLWSELRDGWNQLLEQGLAGSATAGAMETGKVVSVTG
ncbi:MAG: flagellar protein FliS [Planctomycetes bacterium]|nr:flagellar protein FliS [Planctomycetota bacterium]